MGLQPPTVTVRYQHLSVLSRMTVGDRSLPTLKKTVKRRAEVRRCFERVPAEPPCPPADAMRLRSLPRTHTLAIPPALQPALRVLGRGPPKAMFPIIDDASGIIKPGEPAHWNPLGACRAVRVLLLGRMHLCLHC